MFYRVINRIGDILEGTRLNHVLITECSWTTCILQTWVWVVSYWEHVLAGRGLAGKPLFYVLKCALTFYLLHQAYFVSIYSLCCFFYSEDSYVWTVSKQTIERFHWRHAVLQHGHPDCADLPGYPGQSCAPCAAHAHHTLETQMEKFIQKPLRTIM